MEGLITVLYYLLLDPISSLGSILEVLIRAAPLTLTGLCVVVCFGAGFYNIGGEGQLYAGAVLATAIALSFGFLPPLILIPLVLLGGVSGGGLWGLIPTILKVWRGVDEVLSTLLLNSITAYLVSALLNGPWRNPVSLWPQTSEIPVNAQLPIIISQSRFHLGVMLIPLVVLLVYYLLNKTTIGFELRTVGANRVAAQYAGVNIKRTILLAGLIGGGLAGLAGAIEVAGIHRHLQASVSEGFGYTGVIIGTLAFLKPLRTLPVAMLLSILTLGALSLSRVTGIPIYLGDILQGTALLIALVFMTGRRFEWTRRLVPSWRLP